ncbi:RNA polymerase subunit sigma [Sphingobium sp. LB126]|uniref:sigma-70 family RNA polymerase sigma factor n=1 Tax=Sphingobium sp. LB126 TaxID=1983755 RepID=UPI000C20B469|nr:sigma-70 family RNA polymerase sigma factor [Sphingobium sp. LB126]PJG45612.1 RNA polymerase subunit sigma [Sphingobium sp. LB126]
MKEEADLARERLIAALAGVAKQDQLALRQVYELTCAKLFGICLRISGDQESAEDILQDVYVKVWNRAARFDARRASPVTWLCAIARNSAIDWRRMTGKAVLLPEDAASQVADAQPRADEALMARQDRARVFECLEQLDDRTGTSIRAAFFDGLTYAELAERTAMPLATMKSLIRRGLLRLKACLSDE